MQQFLPNGSTLIIRRPTLEDAPALLEIFRQMTRESDFLLYTHAEAMKFGLRDEEDFIRQYLLQPRHLLLLAEANGQIVGSITINQGRQQKQAHLGELGIAVLRDWWNMGIGRRLMTAALRWVEEHAEIEIVHFSVFANNEKAIQLYRNFGFLECGRMPQGVKGTDGQFIDLITMSKRIKNF
ncbi:GNAT family N-acetyltransferase [Chitinophaga horti]|uniref:GNAT family N-acetyltransferase n=1 Tax=Chitinophaga horti TaxID=2920382 RepID=A0ABY6J0Z8_9BACT|nr:GNAT family protein [Chitinophaga horti]UYQ93223.1 GNAT family N-acetyltransferase [Chitinophaga horti]